MAYKFPITFPPQGKMNTDADLKSIPVGDIIDALNCRWGVKNDGTVGTVENVKGNELLPFILPEGNNKCIGGCKYYPDNSVIAFVFNSNNQHSILRIDMVSKTISPILWGEPVLNFSDGYILNSHVIDGILFYLNTNGELQKLIIESAIKYTNLTHKEGIGYWILESDFVVTR